MTFSSAKELEGSVGGARLLVFSCNFASVTSGTVVTGLNNVITAHFTDNVTEEAGLTKKNSDGTTTVNGSVNISGVTSSDTGTLLVIGN